MKKALTFIILLAIFTACKKDDPQPDTGTLKIVNQTSNTYSLRIEGTTNLYNDIAGNTTQEHTLTPGTWTVIATQKTGYIFTPSVYSHTTTIKQNQTSTFTFP